MWAGFVLGVMVAAPAGWLAGKSHTAFAAWRGTKALVPKLRRAFFGSVRRAMISLFVFAVVAAGVMRSGGWSPDS